MINNVKDNVKEEKIVQSKKTSVWIMAPCDAQIREKWCRRFETQCEIFFGEKPLKLEDTEVIIGEPSAEVLSGAKKLRWLQITWAGADKYVSVLKELARSESSKKDLLFTNASGAFGTIISEYVIGSIISLYRSFPKYWENQSRHIWQKTECPDTIFGKKVLILGCGDIGRNIAHRLKAFDAQTIGIKKHDPSGNALKAFEDFDALYREEQLDALLPEADIVIGCLPKTKETTGLLNRKRLQSMKKDAILVNVGRGNLIVTKDLCRVLQEGHLKGAVLDVLDEEPLEENSPLWDMRNVILTPHIAGPSIGNDYTERAIWELCMENLERYLKGRKLEHIVDLTEGY